MGVPAGRVLVVLIRLGIIVFARYLVHEGITRKFHELSSETSTGAENARRRAVRPWILAVVAIGPAAYGVFMLVTAPRREAG